MKAISIKQPYANLVVEPDLNNLGFGIKPIENRSWPCPEKYIGQRVLIHASGKPVPYGSLGDILTQAQYDSLNRNFAPFTFLNCGEIIGSVEIVDCVVNHHSIWAEKTNQNEVCLNGIPLYHVTQKEGVIYNWVLANPIKFEKPIPAKGKLRFWEFDIEKYNICKK